MRTRLGSRLGSPLFAVVAVVAAASGAPAGETRGPEFGNNRYVTSIRHLPGELDSDEYVTPLARGERMSVRVAPAKGSGLAPVLSVLGPDGASRAVTITGRGTAREIRGFMADATGEWTVRVAGSGTTAGEYGAAFATRGAAPFKLRRQTLSGSPLAAEVPIEAVEGTVADVRVTWKAGSGVAVASLRDPSGEDLLVLPENAGRVRTKRNLAEVRGLPLTGGHGTYGLGLAALGADSREFDVTVRLRPPQRVTGRKAVRLTDVEPCLELRSTPILGVAGRAVRLRGSSLVPGVRVFFGDDEATSVTCFGGSFEADAVPPAAAPGTLVAVAAVQPDGQACVRPAYFRYAPVPKITSVTGATGGAIGGWSTAGGLVVHVAGSDFRAGMRVVFPGGVEAVPTALTPDTIVVTSPAGPAATDYLAVADEFGQRGRSPALFEQKTPPTFATSPYAPQIAAVDSSFQMTATGTRFEWTDVLLLDGEPVASTITGTTTRRFTFPASPSGFRRISLRDRLGVVVDGPPFQVKSAATVSSVTVESGPVLYGTGIAAEGGTTLRVDGTDFAQTDTVTLGGAAIQKLAGATATSFRFVAPPLPLGDADLRIGDLLGQETTAVAVVRCIGFADATSVRVPAPGSADDFRAAAAALGDVDGDASADVVLGAPAGSSVGSRSELTRLLVNDGAGTLGDATDSRIPAAGSDVTGADDWNARDVALGDLDGDGDLDLAVAGASPDPWTTGDLRLFANDGEGGFVLDEAAAPPAAAHGVVYAYSEWGSAYAVVGARNPQGEATALALGDLDGDGDPDLVVGRDAVESEVEIVDARYVDFTQSPPFVSYTNVWYHTINRTEFFAASRVLRNDLSDGAGFEDVTDQALPGVGSGSETGLPGLAARDLALADLDGDGDLDLVLGWDDPRTVTVKGLTEGASAGVATTATRVLLNDGGVFSDVTSDWMPAGGASERWQADLVEVADLDGDGDPDLLLLCEGGLDAWQGGSGGSSHALRVLRNDGDSFADVTASVLPSLQPGDDLRGTALAVRDVDGDGTPDLLVATSGTLTGTGGKTLRSMRLLLNSASFRFSDASAFLPAAAEDAGRADALCLGDLDGSGGLSLLLVSTTPAAEREDGAALRAFDWTR